ncbi:hypothetical protein K6W37_10030 [Acetobacter senegalensis]|uniref:hypothetical protein n=1 Tax=Acetobacter senegalensis TaxID=446692 RepID=UPI001EDAF1E8|nr:hypothetical protein [Acetobacter senegalensis]MCG4254223.1 hypothetical protein [Acetobacter senegalensis]
MTTKLQIIGPYTPEHEGPFCTRDGRSVRIITKTDGSKDFPIVGFINNERTASVWTEHGFYFEDGTKDESDLMNAREVPVAREFWINEYAFYNATLHEDEGSAKEASEVKSFIRTIHVREVLPGEGE